MAISDIMGLLGRVGENIGGGTPGIYGGLLSEDELRAAKNRASTKALFDLSASLAEAARPQSGRPVSTFGALAKGLSAAQEGYQGTLQQQAKEKLAMQEMQRQMQSQKRATEVQNLISGAFQPAQAGQAAQPAPYLAGAPYGKATPEIPAQPARFNLEAIAPQLMQTAEGRAAWGEIMKMQEAMQPKLTTLKPEENLGFYKDGEWVSVASGAPKVVKPELAASFAEAVDVLGLQRKNASQYTEAERLAINKKMNELAQSKRQIIMNEGQKGFENTSTLKKQFTSEPIYKAYEDMKVSYGQVSSAIKAGTPIGDTAAATKIMKLLDPGSVVRETELGMAMAATGKMDLLKNYFENYMKGTKLTDSQRSEFQSLADELFNAAASAYNEKRNEYAELGASFNLNTDLALGKPAKVQGAVKRIGW